MKHGVYMQQECPRCSSSPEPSGPVNWERAEANTAMYLQHFLAAQRGFSAPISSSDRMKATAMARDIITKIRDNK